MNTSDNNYHQFHDPGTYGIVNVKTENVAESSGVSGDPRRAGACDNHVMKPGNAVFGDSTNSENYVRQLEENLKLTLAEKESLSSEIIEVNSRLSQFAHELTVERGTVRKMQLENTKLKMNSDARAKEISFSYERNLSIYKRLVQSLEAEVKDLKAKLARFESTGTRGSKSSGQAESDGCLAVTSTFEKLIGSSSGQQPPVEDLTDKVKVGPEIFIVMDIF